jgi:hypothetical protein
MLRRAFHVSQVLNTSWLTKCQTYAQGQAIQSDRPRCHVGDYCESASGSLTQFALELSGTEPRPSVRQRTHVVSLNSQAVDIILHSISLYL